MSDISGDEEFEPQEEELFTGSDRGEFQNWISSPQLKRAKESMHTLGSQHASRATAIARREIESIAMQLADDPAAFDETEDDIEIAMALQEAYVEGLNESLFFPLD